MAVVSSTNPGERRAATPRNPGQHGIQDVVDLWRGDPDGLELFRGHRSTLSEAHVRSTHAQPWHHPRSMARTRPQMPTLPSANWTPAAIVPAGFQGGAGRASDVPVGPLD